MTKLAKEDILNRVIKTFEFIKVDRGLVLKVLTYLKRDELEAALFLLISYNEKCEAKNEIKIARPELHGFEEQEVLTRLIQEAYVTAKLFNAEDRLLNSIWSEDWEIKGKKI
jgi:hypothetical protein